MSGGVRRDGRILNLLKKHSASLAGAVALITSCIPKTLMDAHVPEYFAKMPSPCIPARETTMLDSSLSMVDFTMEALKLPFPEHGNGLDDVLKTLIPMVSGKGADVVHVRSRARAAVRAASNLVRPLTAELQQSLLDVKDDADWAYRLMPC